MHSGDNTSAVLYNAISNSQSDSIYNTKQKAPQKNKLKSTKISKKKKS